MHNTNTPRRLRPRDVSFATRRFDSISIRNILGGTISWIVEELETAFAETLIDISGARLRAPITREAVAELALEPTKPVFALVKSISFDGQMASPAPAQNPADVGQQMLMGPGAEEGKTTAHGL